jgi:DNA (cytosine-5)-methyltransferase 1
MRSTGMESLKHQYLSIFSGIGGGAFGATAAGCELIGAVEFDEKIADLYYQNHRSMVLTQDVKDVDPTVFKVDRSKLLTVQCSPPCQSYSSANLFPDLTSDRALALDNCYHILEHLNPDRIVVENVRAYQKSEPMNRFRKWLKINGYNYIEQIVNCANIGVPQSRIRYFLMAVRKGEIVRHLPSTHSAKLSGQLSLFGDNLKPWLGWYESIADLIPDMQITKLSANQQLALRDWELKHPLLIEGRTRSRAENGRKDRFAIRSQTDPSITVLAGNVASAQMPKLLIPTNGYHSDLPPIYSQHRPAPTVKAMMMSDGESERKGCWRLIDNCEVREMSIRGLARLQTFPDDLILSGNKAVDCRCVGNAIPPIVLQKILEECFE